MSPRTPILVGLVILFATVGLTVFVMSTSKDKFSESSTYPLYADFSDASGIRWKTRLQINGIDVGKIDSIEHFRGPDGRLVARVKLRVLKEYDVYENANLKKAAESLLGDFRLDLDPGTPSHAKLPPEGVISNVQSRSDLDEIQAQLKNVAKNVNNVTESFAKVLGGPDGEGTLKQILENVQRSLEAINETTRALSSIVARNDQVINGIIQDIGKFTNALAIETAQGGDIKLVAENLARLTGRLDKLVASLEGAGGSEQSALRSSVDNLNESVQNINDVTRKIKNGEGTLGKVINDPTLAEKVEATVDDARAIFSGLSRVSTQIELRTQYEVPFEGANEEIQPGIKNILGLRIIPKPDKYYLIEAISDPRGKQTRKITTTNVDGVISKREESVIAFNDLKFSAQFAKRYGFATFRFGFIESTGGLGVNLHALNDRAELRLDVFDFDRRDPDRSIQVNPRVRSTGMFEFVNHLSLQAGLDDPFNSKLRTWFMGGVLRFTDSDLRALLAVAPSP